MDSFEQACAETKQLADSAVQAGARLVRVAKELAKAADEGDIVKIKKATERLRATAAAARQDVANAETAWSLTPDEEEALLRDRYEDELIETARLDGLPVTRHDQRLIVFPSVLRILPAQRAVQIDRKRITALRPTRLVQVLKVSAAKKPKLSPERFIETLYAAYTMVVAAEGHGTGTTLREVYDALTLLPDVRKDYSISDFTRDVFLLDRSGVARTRSGARLSLPAATGTKGSSRMLQFVDRSGEPVTYYGIRFTMT
jgi:hypothetical protein